MEVARFWRTTGQRYQMIGEVCENCGNKIFPPRDICPICIRESGTKLGDLMESSGMPTDMVLRHNEMGTRERQRREASLIK